MDVRICIWCGWLYSVNEKRNVKDLIKELIIEDITLCHIYFSKLKALGCHMFWASVAQKSLQAVIAPPPQQWIDEEKNKI